MLGRFYPRYWAATTISEFGDTLTAVALPIVAFSVTRSALVVGAVAGMQQGTSLMFGVAAGVVTDRGRRGQIMVLADAGCLLATLALALSSWRDNLTIPLLLLGAAMIGTLSVLHESADAAALPTLVSPTDLLRASGQLQAGLFAALALGPVLAGTLITVVGASPAFLIDAATYAIAALLLAGIGPMFAPPVRSPARLTSLWAEARQGFHALRGDVLMLRALELAVACNLLVITVEGQLVPYARRDLRVGPLGIGLFTALGAVAALVTTWAASRGRAVSGRTMLGSTVPAAMSVLIAGLWPTLGTAAATMIAVGGCSGILNTHLRAARQRRFALDVQGRVAMSARVVLYTPPVLALVAGGAVADHLGSPTLFVILSTLAGLLIVSAARGGITQLREEMAAPPGTRSWAGSDPMHSDSGLTSPEVPAAVGIVQRSDRPPAHVQE